LELIDELGPEALTMRGVAARLKVDPMALYRVVADRDGLISDVVELLMDEVDETERPGETWEQTMRRLAASEREMALRHPRAYVLVTAAPTFEGPGLWNAHRVMQLVTKGGLSEDEFFDMWNVIDTWVTGFLLLETELRVRRATSDLEQNDLDASWAKKIAATISERTFWRSFDRVCAGVKAALASKVGVEDMPGVADEVTGTAWGEPLDAPPQ
jgi:AcrR family transcriptional regulator